MRLALWFCSIVALAALGCAQSADDELEVPETFTTVERPPDPNELRREDAAAGWIKLFDGETLFGWAPPIGDWRFEDGALVSDGAGPAVLSTTTEFADYELRWEAWVGEGSEGALALRTSADTTSSAQSGLHVWIATSDAAESGSAALRLPASKPNEWTKHSAVVQGGTVKVVPVDGADTSALTAEFPADVKTGRISLVAASRGPIKIRSLYLKPLGTVPLFNGQDLSGWHPVPGGTAVFEPIVRGKESRIYVHKGGGYLETDEKFDNFVLQAEIAFNGQGYDSGILFRTQSGTAEMPASGYEMQLNNETDDDDRTLPLDFGTGGLHGLVAARKLVSQNFFWFVPTLVAHGNHIAVWVNGVQVTDFTDTRPASDNPREGSCTGAGHFSLQASGDEVDIFFKSISVARLPSES
jgi:hypothetical protein